ncbi:uncharacterized protein BDW43DRAFT_312883 [Aspergillus alliaceus]|uniref:uncharacterized protein n=1 Tax=Petromyces alliaceus TaxID=209559 RepID=UPI0012A61310|nr:uncharacterized protein BDW43DRAFT_312883 [Aspergillus alliaceus]KAB8231663.1 hypothetical protein BDW43DRAFT_312883 [Aspergillus alliaceus]
MTTKYNEHRNPKSFEDEKTVIGPQKVHKYSITEIDSKPKGLEIPAEAALGTKFQPHAKWHPPLSAMELPPRNLG